MEVKEAIKIIEELGIDCRGYPTLKKAVDVVLEYTKVQLSQEGTTKDATSLAACSTIDSISRQAAIDTVTKHYRIDNDLLELIAYEMEKLPSAQPERKTGYWIFVHPLQEDDCGAYMCSNCRTGHFDIEPHWNFCPNCGADMRG